MADAPATTQPAAAAVANPSPPASSPAPSLSPPASPPSRAPAPAAVPEIDFETPIEYDDGNGGVVRTTYGELIKAQERLKSLGDVNQYQDLIAAMNNDPEATERVLRKQLADIEAAKAKQTPQGNAEVSALKAELAEIKALLKDSARVTTTIQQQQDEAILENLLARDQVKGKLPYLSYNVKEGARVARAVVDSYKKQVAAAGGEWTNQHLLQALSVAENRHRQTLAPYGIDPTKPAAAQGGAAVTAVNNGQSPGGNVLREAIDTPESLLRSRMPGQSAPAPVVVGNGIPEAGGAVGGSPAGQGGTNANQRYNSEGLLQRIKARSAAGGGA